MLDPVASLRESQDDEIIATWGDTIIVLQADMQGLIK